MTTRQRMARRAEETVVWIGRNMLAVILLVALACAALPVLGQTIIEARELVAEAQGLLAEHGLAWRDVLTLLASAAFLYWMMVLEAPKRRFDRRDNRPGYDGYPARRNFHRRNHRR
jgi:hypothetical protein